MPDWNNFKKNTENNFGAELLKVHILWKCQLWGIFHVQKYIACKLAFYWSGQRFSNHKGSGIRCTIIAAVAKERLNKR